MFKKLSVFIILLALLASCKKLIEYNTVDDSKTKNFEVDGLSYEANYNEDGGLVKFIKRGDPLPDIPDTYKIIERFEYSADGDIIVLNTTTWDIANNELTNGSTSDKDEINFRLNQILDFINKHVN